MVDVIMSMLAWLIIGIVVIFIVYMIYTYNVLISRIEITRNSERQIDVQLDRRYKVFESLIQVVKKYTDYEKTVLTQVTALRSQAESAKSTGDKAGQMQAENAISSIVKGLNVQFEAYPDLKANQSYLQLQEEITNTENKLAFSKQAYNDSVEIYTAYKKSFLAQMIVKLFSGALNRDFMYWSISDARKTELEDYTVKM